ncbi:MAG: 3-dehydroquinate synthase [Deltaproteobacteria bacterium]
MKTLTVGLGDRSYPIVIKNGVLREVGSRLAAEPVGRRYFVISDDRVAALYGEILVAGMQSAGLAVELLTFSHGEESKNLQTIAMLASRLAEKGADRKDALIALGGGVTGDIVGFLAAIYMRGIPFVQVPTTLLSQVDSSVGGKTGVDIPEGKNLVGAFYQPKAVYIDSEVLKSLPYAELLNGLAEVIKYGVIYDADFFDRLETQRDNILAMDLTLLEEVIARCCEIKAAVVAADEKESDFRRILNFGHTIGHAVEGASGYTLAHGMAVAIGMVAVARLAVKQGILSDAEAGRLMKLIENYGMPSVIPAGLDRLMIRQYLKTDKKAVGGRPFFVLPTAIGKVIITDEVDDALLEQVLAG